MVNKFVTATLALLVITSAVFAAGENTCGTGKCADCGFAANGTDRECKECALGYIRGQIDGATLYSCTPQPNLPANCIDVKLLSTTCNVCEAGRVKSATGTCEKEGDIKNCRSYKFAADGTTVLCSLCDAGYFPATDEKTCKEVPAADVDKNCRYYSNVADSASCSVCEPGYGQFGGN